MNPRVSVFDGCERPAPRLALTLDQVADAIRTDASIAEDTRLVRAASGNKDEQNRLKKPMPAVTLAGEFSYRSRGEWSTASGLVQVDIDDVDAVTLERARALLTTSPWCALCYTSPRGVGLKAAIYVADLVTPSLERYRIAWDAVTAWLASHGLVNDPSTKDASRLAFLAHDPDVHLRVDAQPFPLDAWTQPAVEPPVRKEHAAERPGDAYSATGDHRALLERNGWKLDGVSGENERWTRPGKDDGTSATWHVGRRVFYPFTSSTELEPGRGRSLFQLRADLEHGGDHAACARALAQESSTAAPRDRQTQGATPVRLSFEWFSRTQEERQRWLWQRFIPLAATSVIGAKGGTGKGLVVSDIIARFTTGRPMPDGTGGGEPGRALIATREDDPNTALMPRLRIAGADMSRVAWTHGDLVSSDDRTVAAHAMDALAPALEETVRAHGIGLVVIDPLGSWIEDDANSSAQIRAVIDPMTRMARRTGCAVLFVAHLRKGAAEDPSDAFSGSRAVVDAVRCALRLDRLSENERTLSVVKTNSRAPEGPVVLSFERSPQALHEDDPPCVRWRAPTVEDLAVKAAQAKRGAPPVIPFDDLWPLMPQEHKPLKAVERAACNRLRIKTPKATVKAVHDAILELIEGGKLFEGKDEHGAKTVGRQQPEPTPAERAAAHWKAKPDASVREIAALAACGVATADRARILVFGAAVRGSTGQTSEQPNTTPEQSPGECSAVWRAPIGSATTTERRTPDGEVQEQEMGTEGAA